LTFTGANAASSTNIVNNNASLTLPNVSPNAYMTAVTSSNGSVVNMSASAMDAPGSGTFYYTVWMSSSTSKTFGEMMVELIVLNILP